MRKGRGCHTAGVTLHAITVLGHDRPGIIAETTERLAGLGLNLEDSTMTLLRGHFAMMLVCDGDVAASRIEETLVTLTTDGLLTVTVREVPRETGPDVAGTPYVLTVHGGDRPGIVAAVLAEVAAAGGNVTDLTTRLAGELYLLVADLDLPASAAPEDLAASVRRVAGGLGVEATLRHADADEL
jgi:glycine cleavage system transcriptional repressor